MLQDRTSEWFVPKFGSRNFRVTIGLLFLPYTSIVTCFAAWGSLSGSFETERLIAVCVIYFLALGVSAHLLDAVGGKTKPWGDLPKRKLWTVSMIVLGIAFTIGMYYAFLDSPLLFAIGIAEGFFLFAYNLELFGGKVSQQLVNNNCMGHTADFCRLGNPDKLNIAGSNHTLWNFFGHNLCSDNNFKKV